MDLREIEVKSVDSWSKKEIVNLYKSAGWWKDCFDSSEIDNLIKNSFVFVVAFEKSSKKAVGMGRLLSDGISDAYIQDLVVLKKYRGKGVGKKIVNFLLDICRENKISWIGLISEPGQNIFYEKIGFKEMKEYTPMKFRGKV